MSHTASRPARRRPLGAAVRTSAGSPASPVSCDAGRDKVRYSSAPRPQALQQGLLAGLQVAAVEEADLDAVVEQHPVAAPDESVGKNHYAFRPGGNPEQVHLGLDALAEGQVDLGRQLAGQLVLVPEGHGPAW